MQYCSVVPREAVEKYDADFRSHVLGTGPFYLKIWQEKIKMVLRRNPFYYERDQKGKLLPYLEAINVSFFPDKYTEFLQFVQGKIDFISGLDVSYKDELLTPSGTALIGICRSGSSSILNLTSTRNI